MRPGRARLAIAILALSLAADRAASSPRDEAARRLATAERQRAEQSAASAAATRALDAARARAVQLADQRAQAAAELRTVETGVIAATARLAAATAARDTADAALTRAQADFAALLPLMIRLRAYPAETVLAVPATPSRALEGLLITRGLATELNREAAELRARQDQAARLRAATSHEQAVLDGQRAEQTARAATLERDVAEANGRVDEAETAARDAAGAIAATAARAKTLRDALTAMDAAQTRAVAQAARQAAQAERRGQTALADKAKAKHAALARPMDPAPSVAAGGLVPPAAGVVVRPFGAPDEDGPSTGLTLGTAPEAFVSSPCAGRVGFAAPFRSYGRLVIVECGAGRDVVLAGLGRIDAAPGHAVRPGEPIGRMPATPSRPGLYVELRAGGQPIDPAPFLRGNL